MITHTTASREQWLAARLELLEAEKELTRRSDDVARQRQQLPWVPVEKDYRFETRLFHKGRRGRGWGRLARLRRMAMSCSSPGSATSCSSSGGLRAAGWPVYPGTGVGPCRQSFNKLWVAVISSHSARQAPRPLRWKRSTRRLCLVWANTGSMIACLWR
jgi:hypothetical protein